MNYFGLNYINVFLRTTLFDRIESIPYPPLSDGVLSDGWTFKRSTMSRGSVGLANERLVVLDENNSSISTFDGEKWGNRFIENFEIGQNYQLLTIKDTQSET